MNKPKEFLLQFKRPFESNQVTGIMRSELSIGLTNRGGCVSIGELIDLMEELKELKIKISGSMSDAGYMSVSDRISEIERIEIVIKDEQTLEGV